MDLHRLSHFVVVAEELHFGRAAQRLGMTQPPLSQSILHLEKALGVQLFERSRRRVALTPAGTVLLEEAHRLLAQAIHAETMTRRAASGELGRLTVGFVPSSMYRVLPQAIRAFRSRWAGIDVRLEEMPSVVQIERLRNGSIDVGILLVHGESSEGLNQRLIGRDRFVAAVPAASAHARAKALKLAQLADEPFVLFQKHASPGLYAVIHSAFREAGFVPKVTQTATQTYTMLCLVAAGVGVALVPEASEVMNVRGVAFVPIVDLSDAVYLEMVVAWTSGPTSPIKQAFVDLVAKDVGVAKPRGSAARVHRPRSRT